MWPGSRGVISPDTRLSLGLFSPLVEAGLERHPQPIPGPTGEQEEGPGWRAGSRWAWLPARLAGPVFLDAA